MWVRVSSCEWEDEETLLKGMKVGAPAASDKNSEAVWLTDMGVHTHARTHAHVAD